MSRTFKTRRRLAAPGAVRTELITEVLTEAERQELGQRITRISQLVFRLSLAVGEELWAIKSKGLYREHRANGKPSWSTFIKDHFPFRVARANQCMRAFRVFQVLRDAGEPVLPTREAHCRALVPWLNQPEELLRRWRLATTSNGQRVLPLADRIAAVARLPVDTKVSASHEAAPDLFAEEIDRPTGLVPAKGRMIRNHYGVISVDAPWTYASDPPTPKSGTLQIPYPTMKLEDIKALPVQEIAAPDCALFMWATGPMLPEAFEVIEAWGFRYRTMAFVWSKTFESGKKKANLGRWTLSNVEYVLLATKGHPQRVANDVRQLVEAPPADHSRKPQEVAKRIQQLMGDVPRIELFARERRPGWHVWGDEVDSDVDLLSVRHTASESD